MEIIVKKKSSTSARYTYLDYAFETPVFIDIL